MEVHIAFVVILCLFTASSVLTLLISIGKFFCVGFLEEIWDCLMGEIEGLTIWLSYISGFFLIFSWWGYMADIDFLFAIGMFFGCIIGVFSVIFMLIIVISEYIVPKVTDMHENIRRKRKGW